jgi:starch phosphorylase
MKLMLNGALTIGTMDGANVEIAEEVGRENMFIFGLSSAEVLKYENNGGYDPYEIFNNDQNVRQVLMQLVNGTYSADNPELFRPLYDSLLKSSPQNPADRYFILKDFESYAAAQREVDKAYSDQKKWMKMSILNTACSGKFSSDRTIQEYVRDIWHLKQVSFPEDIPAKKIRYQGCAGKVEAAARVLKSDRRYAWQRSHYLKREPI